MDGDEDGYNGDNKNETDEEEGRLWVDADFVSRSGTHFVASIENFMNNESLNIHQ